MARGKTYREKYATIDREHDYEPAEAVPYLQTLWPGSIIRDPFAAYEMGRAYAELGENRKAVVAYEEALAAWRDADPILRPRIEAARREVARLGGAGE